MIQGMSGVTKDIPPYITASNDGHYAGINKTGLSRRGFTHEQIMAIHDVCRILFQSDLNYLNACDKAEKELPQSSERDYLLKFVRSSQRGCIKPYLNKSAK
jgi:UDP-N-acetylglucosamine acyltransferase